MRALHPKRQRLGRYQGGAGNRGHPRDRDNESGGTGRNPPLYKPDSLHRGSCKCSYLGGLPLPLLNPRWDGYGASDRRIRCEKHHAASSYGRTAATAAAGPGSCCTITNAPPGSLLGARWKLNGNQLSAVLTQGIPRIAMTARPDASPQKRTFGQGPRYEY